MYKGMIGNDQMSLPFTAEGLRGAVSPPSGPEQSPRGQSPRKILKFCILWYLG